MLPYHTQAVCLKVTESELLSSQTKPEVINDKDFGKG